MWELQIDPENHLSYSEGFANVFLWGSFSSGPLHMATSMRLEEIKLVNNPQSSFFVASNAIAQSKAAGGVFS